MFRHRILSFAFGITLGFGALVAAQPPATLTFQGRMIDAAGLPITHFTVVNFQIFHGGDPHLGGGDLVYEENATITPDATGIFLHSIGTGSIVTPWAPLSVDTFDTDQFVYVAVTIDGSPLLPRTLITPAGYALIANRASVAADAESLGGLPASAYLSSGEISFAAISGEITDAQITDSLTVGPGSSVDVSALPPSVTLLGPSLDLATEVSGDLDPDRLVGDTLDDDMIDAALVGVGLSDAQVSDALTVAPTGSVDIAALTIPGEIRGDVLYFNGAQWMRLPPGSAGQVLQTLGTGGEPQWANVLGALTDATAPDLTLRWNGTNWVETHRLTVSDTGVVISPELFVTSSLEISGEAILGSSASAELTIHAGTITMENWDWGDDQVADDLTVSAVGAVDIGALFVSGESQGDVLFFDGASWTHLPPGVSGQVLQTVGAGGSPLWANIAGTIPDGTVGDSTLRWNGANWVESSTLSNRGTDITVSVPLVASGDVTLGNESGDTLTIGAGTVTIPNHDWTDDQVADDLTVSAAGSIADGALSASVAHLTVSEAISADWDNSANPWADAEVADDLTISASGSVADGALSGNVTLLGGAINLASSAEVTGVLPDANVADDITLTSITQLTSREIADTTGDLDADRLAGDTVDDDLVDAALIGDGLTDAQVSDTLTVGASGSVDDGSLSAQVAHLNVAETIAADWINTANPWSDAEVSDDLTISASGSIADGALSSNVSLLGLSIDLASEVTGTLSAASVGTGLTDAQVNDDITLTSVTQVTGRALADMTRDLDTDRLVGDTIDDDLVDAALIGVGLTDAQMSDTLTIGPSSTVDIAALVTAGQATGDHITFDGSQWVRSAPGPSGRILVSQGPGNPTAWAASLSDAQIDDDLTISAAGSVADGALSASVAHLDVAETLSADWVNTANPWADSEVADDITLTSITQITGRALADTSGDLDPDRLAGDTVDNDLIDTAIIGTGLTDAQIADDITLTSITQVTGRALADTTGDLDPDRLAGDTVNNDLVDDALLTSNVAHLNAAETISSNWVNTANPWADSEVSDTLTIASTGAVDIAALSVSTEAQGDLIAHSGSGWTRLGVGSENQVLRVISGSPSWQNLSGVVPDGSSSGDTLRWSGAAWSVSSALSNDGTDVTLTGDLSVDGDVILGDNPADGLTITAGTVTMNGYDWIDAQVSDTLTLGSSSQVHDNALSANVAHLNAAETIAANWINTANPWADNEVTDTLTIGSSSTVSDSALSANVAHLNAAETIAANWVNTANPWADSEVADNLTLSGGVINSTAIGGTVPAAGAFTTLSATGDISTSGGDIDAQGGHRMAFNLMRENVTASLTDDSCPVLGFAGNTEYVMPFAGSVVGISVASNALRTGGVASVGAAVNGVGTGLTTQIDAGNTLYNSSTQAKDTDTFSAGDRLGVYLTTDGSWAPATADFVITVIVEM
jgi:hypothetical protein